MKQRILRQLKQYNKKRITFLEICDFVPPDTPMESVYEVVSIIASEGYLLPTAKHGLRAENPEVYNTYTIDKSFLKKEDYKDLQSYALKLNKHILLDAYYELPKKVFKRDLIHIEKINAYLNENGLAVSSATIQERAYDLVGDEKWLIEGDGVKVLNRLGLKSLRENIISDEPVMFALQAKFYEKTCHQHLIVENKAIYLRLLTELETSNFSTLIFGAGWRILAGIDLFTKQFPFQNVPNKYYYFGDLDHEGIKIYEALNAKQAMILAIPFYKAMLKKSRSSGKTNQLPDAYALEHFLSHFDDESQEKIKTLLAEGAYYPQESLKKEELKRLWEQCHEL